MRLGDNPRLSPTLWWEYGPRDVPEGPEVWCRVCEWFAPEGHAHIYGRMNDEGGR